MNKLILALALALPLSAAAGGLPEGSFKGHTPVVRDPNVMALLIRKDPARPGVSYAVLAEYTRLKGIPGPERLEITSWIPRMHAFQVEQLSPLRYAFRPLHVVNGELETDGRYVPGALQLAKPGTLDGATLTRFDRDSALFAETITFDGRVGSTWEPYVQGNFFWAKDSSGGDYFKKGINTVLSDDQVADFRTADVRGSYQMTEKLPGLWTLSPKGQSLLGADKVTGRIGVFIDIVNWKPLFTTNELLLINPDDARDVGFFYQRH